MADDNNVAERPRFGFGMMRRPMAPPWRMTVVERTQTTPRMLSVSFAGAALADLAWTPGQDLVLSLPQPNGDVARRHYTIRDFNREAQRLVIDFVLHGDSPATRWARGAAAGAVIEVQGPRGRTRLSEDAALHLFVGDETCVPAIFAMIERLPAGAKAHALIEVDGPDEAQPVASAADVTIEWVARDGAHPGPSDLLLNRLKALAPAPTGVHAYTLGETSNVRAQRHYLQERGFQREQMTAEGYWRPGRIGGHDHV
jgi:NADPH-dependent ferric siderophore reductase